MEETVMATSNFMRLLYKCFMPQIVLLIVCCFTSPAGSFELLLGTDDATSFSHFAGKRLCHSLSRYAEGISCKTVSMENSTDVLTNIQSGSFDLALVNSKIIYDAFNKTGLFQFTDIQYDDLRLLLPLYREPISLLVRDDVKLGGLSDLKGKRINAGPPSSMQHFIFEEIMKAMGWTRESFSLYQNLSSVHSQDYLAFNNGSVQAMIHIGMHPDWKLRKQIIQSGSRLVAVDDPAIVDLSESKSGFCLCIIEGGTYPGYKSDLKTLAVETLLITSADADNGTVEKVLEGIYAAKEHLQYTHPSFLNKKVDIETLNNSYLHPHPAATLFFQQYLHRL